MLRVVVLRVLFFVDMGLPRICCADLYCLKLVFTLSLRHHDTCVIIDYLTALMASTHVVICR